MSLRSLTRLLGASMLAAVVAGCVSGGNVTGSSDAVAQSLPEIRLTARNRVPACVTPQRLMAFLEERNQRLPPQFRDIAHHYREHGERLGVRWDYAFFQMIIETNYLLFRNGAGKGDVNARQNNFAGIGTTGGGVPGDSYPDVSTGVLAQMQHLIAYSGERVPNPVGRRTREKQDDIIALSRRLGRPVTFRDLAGRWAVDRRYGRSIQFIAERYRSRFCTGRQPPEPEVAAPAPATQPARGQRTARNGMPRDERMGAGAQSLAAATDGETQGETAGAAATTGLVRGPAPARRPAACKVFTASYGGQRNVLIRRQAGAEIHYTALQVLDGQEESLAESFIRSHAEGGVAISQHETRQAALVEAFQHCPAAAGTAGGAQGKG